MPSSLLLVAQSGAAWVVEVSLPSRVLVLVAVIVAAAGPLLAYAVYPGEPPRTSVGRGTGYHVVMFIKAIKHCHYYLGIRRVGGVVAAALPHGFLMEAPRLGRVAVVLPPCIVMGGRRLSSIDAARMLIGRHVLVVGRVFETPVGVVIRPRIILVGGKAIHVKPCHCPCMPCCHVWRHR